MPFKLASLFVEISAKNQTAAAFADVRAGLEIARGGFRQIQTGAVQAFRAIDMGAFLVGQALRREFAPKAFAGLSAGAAIAAATVRREFGPLALWAQRLTAPYIAAGQALAAKWTASLAGIATAGMAPLVRMARQAAAAIGGTAAAYLSAGRSIVATSTRIAASWTSAIAGRVGGGIATGVEKLAGVYAVAGASAAARIGAAFGTIGGQIARVPVISQMLGMGRGLGQAVVPIAQGLIAGVKAAAPGLTAALGSAFAGASAGLKTMLGGLGTVFGGLGQVLGGTFRIAAQVAGTAFRGVARLSVAVFRDAAQTVGHAFSGAIGMAGNALRGLSALRIPALIGVAALGIGFVTAVKGASDLAESVNKVEVIFGKASGQVTSFADRMADKFGLVRTAALEAVGGIGQILKASGFTKDKAASMGVAFAQMAADLSSIANIPMASALEKIQSGLVGESRPLREVGVLLSEEAVQRKAVTLGIAKQGKELTDMQKVQARAVIIQEQLGYATGDLANTAGGFANQWRELQGRIQNTLADFGKAVLPAVTRVVHAFNVMFQDIAGGIAGASPGIKSFADRIAGYADYIAVAWQKWPTFVELAVVLAKIKLLDMFTQVEPTIVRVWEFFVAKATDAMTIVKNLIVGVGQFMGNLFAKINYNAAVALMPKLPGIPKPDMVDLAPSKAEVDLAFGDIFKGTSMEKGVKGFQKGLDDFIKSLDRPDLEKQAKTLQTKLDNALAGVFGGELLARERAKGTVPLFLRPTGPLEPGKPGVPSNMPAAPQVAVAELDKRQRETNKSFEKTMADLLRARNEALNKDLIVHLGGKNPQLEADFKQAQDNARKAKAAADAEIAALRGGPIRKPGDALAAKAGFDAAGNPIPQKKFDATPVAINELRNKLQQAVLGGDDKKPENQTAKNTGELVTILDSLKETLAGKFMAGVPIKNVIGP